MRKINVTLEFWCEGLEESTDVEVREALEIVLDSGAEATNTELALLEMEIIVED